MSEESENSNSSSKPVQEELIARRGSASLAWRWFGFDKKDEQQTSPICRICRKQIAVKQSATTNLFHHLRTTHKTQFEEYERLRAEQNSTAATSTTSYFPEDHTGELIAQGLKDALSSWSLDDKRMVCMTTDSGANVVSALRINNWQRLPCFGHRLHIAIERSMRDPRIGRALGVCKKVVAAFSNSWKKKKALAKVTVSYVTPVLSLFNNDVLAVQSDDTDLTKDIKRSILTYLNSKFAGDNVVELLGMASTLDPRFKHRYNKDEQILAIESALKAELMALGNEEDQQAATEAAASHSTTAVPEEEGTTSDSETLPAKKKKKSFGSYFKKTQQANRVEESLQTAVEKEMQSYLMIPEIDSDTDPLSWWKAQEVNFPRIGKLARKYLCIPASSSPSERAFSTGGNVVTCQRASLKPEAVDRLVFLSHNMKKKISQRNSWPL
ncbi:unnamed protein product [Leuciscus chuanchicus]